MPAAATITAPNAEIAEIVAQGVYLLSQREVADGAEIVSGRVLARIELGSDHELVVTAFVVRSPRRRGTGTIDHGRVTLSHIGTATRPQSLSIRTRHLAAVLRALGEAHVEAQRARRDDNPDNMRVVDVDEELLTLADEAGVDTTTILRAASAALLELNDAGRAELIAEARDGAR